MQTNDYTILYVEDEDGTRINMAKSMRLKCKDVYEAKDGLEAYKLYNEKKPDLIITDLQMPNMGGLEFIEKIRESDKNIPIIVISAFSDRDKQLQVEELDIVEYVVKPISRASLKEILALGFSKIK